MRAGRRRRDEGNTVRASPVTVLEFAEGGMSIGREMGKGEWGNEKEGRGGHVYDHEWSLLKFKNFHF